MGEFETDEHGDVILKPVTGWTVTHVAGVSVLAAIRYLETPEELETGESKVVQLVMTPAMSLELAEVLTSAANKLLEPPAAGTVLH